MKRRYTERLTLLSLVVCIASAGLWVRSYFSRDLVMWHSPWGTVRVWWMTGSLVVAGDNLWHGRPYWEFESDYAWPGINYGQPMEAEYSLLNALGFSYVAPPDFVPTNVPGFAYDPSVVGGPSTDRGITVLRDRLRDEPIASVTRQARCGADGSETPRSLRSLWLRPVRQPAALSRVWNRTSVTRAFSPCDVSPNLRSSRSDAPRTGQKPVSQTRVLVPARAVHLGA